MTIFIGIPTFHLTILFELRWHSRNAQRKSRNAQRKSLSNRGAEWAALHFLLSWLLFLQHLHSWRPCGRQHSLVWTMGAPTESMYDFRSCHRTIQTLCAPIRRDTTGEYVWWRLMERRKCQVPIRAFAAIPVFWLIADVVAVGQWLQSSTPGTHTLTVATFDVSTTPTRSRTDRSEHRIVQHKKLHIE